MPQAARGTKRGREIEGIDKVSSVFCHVRCLNGCDCSSFFVCYRRVALARDVPISLRFERCYSPATCLHKQAKMARIKRPPKPLHHRPPRQQPMAQPSPSPKRNTRSLTNPTKPTPLSHPPSTQEEDYLRRPAIRLFIPDGLKSILVDDWEKVTKEAKLAVVPSPTPISQFLNEYYASEAETRRPGSADADILEEVVAGVREYFNKALGRVLLYRFERGQFYEVLKQVESGHGEHAGKQLTDMYGCEHLLRLFGKPISLIPPYSYPTPTSLS